MSESAARSIDRLALGEPPRPLIDAHDRAITYLRLSVTDRCDLRCTYCMPERMRFLPKSELLSLEELATLADGFIARGVTKIRITGGEPLVRRDVTTLITALGKRIGDGLKELTLTTNATRLTDHAEALAQAGVRRVNVSLDTRDRARFASLSRRDALPRVLDGIAAARAAGLRVKINTVALKGVNEDELGDLAEWAHGEGHDITIIEVMPLGEVGEDRGAHYLPLDRVRARLEERWTLQASDHASGGPARYVDVAETGGRIGFITPHTHNFCASCNRMRVTATGQLYPCLGDAGRIDCRAALRSDAPARRLEEALDRAMAIKPSRHDFRLAAGEGGPALSRHMSVTGG
ncbi:GTP 3',8-cyclase MoaA [Qipengyuania nanhaisediminis]|uniref:GTP 3',8-cyclase MoaA n=1 Tax=Qipengyuania nanhaisediminis TaxID=604088 RepID=UPI0038B3AB29